MPVSISLLLVAQQRLLLLGLLLFDFETFIECIVGEYKCELIVTFCIADFALAFATAEGDRDTADLDRLG